MVNLALLLVANLGFIAMAFAFKWKYRYFVLVLNGIAAGVVVGRMAGVV